MKQAEIEEIVRAAVNNALGGIFVELEKWAGSQEYGRYWTLRKEPFGYGRIICELKHSSGSTIVGEGTNPAEAVLTALRLWDEHVGVPGLKR